MSQTQDTGIDQIQVLLAEISKGNIEIVRWDLSTEGTTTTLSIKVEDYLEPIKPAEPTK